MANYQTRDIELQEAVTSIGEGRIRLPEFQRNFTWALSDQRSLLESIQKAYPVGTLLLLEVASNGTGPFGERPFEGAPEPVKSAELLVLDGQQRLSSCFRAFSPNAPRVFAIDLGRLFAATKGQARRPVDFGEFITVKSRPTHLENLLYNRNLLPFEFLTDRDTLRERLATYRENLGKKPETAEFGKFVDVYLEGYVDVFFDYRFPAVVLPASLDIEAVANVFTKINTTGLRLSAFDLCVATLFPKGINLREMWAAARETDQIRAMDQDGTNLLQTVALIAGQPPKKSALVKNLTKAHIDAHWDNAVDGLTRAGDLLAKVGVPDSSAVPYDAMIPALAAALAGTPTGGPPPALEGLRLKAMRWVQQTAFLQRYNEGTDVKQAADYPAAAAWLKGGDSPSFLGDTIVWQQSWDKLSRSGARYRAIVALLNERGPRDLILNDKQLGRGLPSRHPAQLHHIFPRAFLRDSGYATTDIELALNITFLTPESNNFISDRPPSQYLEERIQDLAILGKPREAAIADLKALLADHLVNEDGWNALLRDDYEAFLAARSAAARDRLGGLGIPVVVAPAEEEGEDGQPGEIVDEDSASEPSDLQ